MSSPEIINAPEVVKELTRLREENDRLREALIEWRRFWGTMSSNAIEALPPHAKREFEDAAQATIQALGKR